MGEHTGTHTQTPHMNTYGGGRGDHFPLLSSPLSVVFKPEASFTAYNWRPTFVITHSMKKTNAQDQKQKFQQSSSRQKHYCVGQTRKIQHNERECSMLFPIILYQHEIINIIGMEVFNERWLIWLSTCHENRRT